MSIIEAIAEHDKSLSLLRESWMEATPEKKSRWMELINASLDERLRLMRKRDEEGLLK